VRTTNTSLLPAFKIPSISDNDADIFNDDEYLYLLKISDIYFRFNLTTSVEVNIIPQQAEVAQGVPGRLRPGFS